MLLKISREPTETSSGVHLWANVAYAAWTLRRAKFSSVKDCEAVFDGRVAN
jgi:hypothetical protein